MPTTKPRSNSNRLCSEAISELPSWSKRKKNYNSQESILNTHRQELKEQNFVTKTWTIMWNTSKERWINQTTYQGMESHSLRYQKMRNGTRWTTQFTIHSTHYISCRPIRNTINCKVHCRRLGHIQLLGIVKFGKTWIPKTASKDPKMFGPILDESIITGNSILLKSYGIILPAKIQKEAIRLVHKSSYANINSTGRRLRSYSFFNDMRSKVKVFMNICTNWKTFVDKKTMEPLNFPQVTSRTGK